MRCQSLRILEEGKIEPDETILVTLSLLTHGRGVVLGNASTTVILENDGGKVGALHAKSEISICKFTLNSFVVSYKPCNEHRFKEC